MKLSTVINKLKKEFKYDFKEDDEINGIVINSQELTFTINSEQKCRAFHVRQIRDKSDAYSDYSAGTFAHNFKQAIEWLSFS